jgi:hypothetical protein
MGKRDERRAGGEEIQDAPSRFHGGVRELRSVERRRRRKVDGTARQDERRQDARRQVVSRGEDRAVSGVDGVERKGAGEEENSRRERAAPGARDSECGQGDREKKRTEPAGARPAGRERRDERERRRARGEDSRCPTEDDGRFQRIAASS